MSKFVKDYCYQEIRIEEIEEINQIIEDYNSFYNLPRQGRGDAGDEYAYRRTFFRGQSNSEWKIIPSILRKKDRQDELIIDKETPIFEELAYKQHYKTGTGCLDFTVDINIALFFACNQNFEKDAAVFLWGYSPHEQDWTTTSIQSELGIMQKKEKMSVQEFSEQIWKKYPEVQEKSSSLLELNTYIVSFLEHGFMVIPSRHPKKSNLRMERQKGSLYVCGVEFETPVYEMQTSSRAGKNIFYPNKIIVPDELNGGNSLVKIIIPADFKCEILKMLKKKNITEKYLLPNEER